MIGTDNERESGKPVLSAQFDDDDDIFFVLISIHVCACVYNHICVLVYMYE